MRRKRLSRLLIEEERRGYSFTRAEDASWIHTHLPFMQFTVPYEKTHPSILTIVYKRFFPELQGEGIWIKPELREEQITNWFRLDYIMQDVFRAYVGGGPAASEIDFKDGGWGFKQSYIFWNWALLENACRVFPLPDALQPGKPDFRGAGPSPKGWASLEYHYNITPEELYLPPKG